MSKVDAADKTAEWERLVTISADEAKEGVTIASLFASDPNRFADFSHELPGGLLVDLSKQRVSRAGLEALLALAKARGVDGARRAMRSGERINFTEDRSVLHVALRDPSASAKYPGATAEGGEDTIAADVGGVLDRMKTFCDAVRGGELRGHTGKAFTDVVNIGIGGSDLGPVMAVEALRPDASGVRVHFVSNVDGAHIAGVTAPLDPETTLVLVASKTFTTQETLRNAESARDWLRACPAFRGAEDAAVGAHFAALSTNADKVRAFGIDPDARMFPFWDFVGGRYSMWSAIGLPVALAVGFDKFREMLDGAAEVDAHFFDAPLERNVPVLKALCAVWNVNFLGAGTVAVLPYDEGMKRVPAYLQQLSMESNGKGVDASGRRLPFVTGPIVFGEPGTNGQHSFYQLLHQSPQIVPCDFIAPAETRSTPAGPTGAEHHRILLSNFFAQTEALMHGKSLDQVATELAASGIDASTAAALAPHKVFTGNRPTTSIVLPRVEPRTLGALIALYEHEVFVQGIIWGINSFDQWGVELGKQLAKKVLPEIDADGDVTSHDASTNGLINHVNSLRRAASTKRKAE